MHAMKTGLSAEKFAFFLDVSKKVLSLIRFSNDPYRWFSR